ncbi:MAG: cyclodeaminase/cyclohydrolase family protein [Steroidobacteraceae bacterium]
MTIPVSGSTLERFREAAASGHPTPAGVAVAAVSASFAFGLLAKALAVSGRRDARSVNLAKLEPLTAAVRAESSRMLQLADDDIAAFEAYLAGARLPHATDRERLERRQALDSALRQAIDLPLAAARSAAVGLQLCAEAVSMTHLVVLADLATAVTLLSGALRAFLLCAGSNVRQLAPETSSHRELLAKETDRHKRVLRQAEEVLERVTGALEAAAPKP